MSLAHLEYYQIEFFVRVILSFTSAETPWKFGLKATRINSLVESSSIWRP
jgi:hypothetical protein